MKKLLIVCAVIACAVFSSVFTGESTEPNRVDPSAQTGIDKGDDMCGDNFDDFVTIRKVLGWYIEGGIEGKSEIMKKAFHADAIMYSQQNGKIAGGPIQNLFDAIDSRPGSKDLKAEITSIQIHGTVANARVELRNLGGNNFSDMFLLVKEGNDWKILAKVYHTN